MSPRRAGPGARHHVWVALVDRVAPPYPFITCQPVAPVCVLECPPPAVWETFGLPDASRHDIRMIHHVNRARIATHIDCVVRESRRCVARLFDFMGKRKDMARTAAASKARRKKTRQEDAGKTDDPEVRSVARQFSFRVAPSFSLLRAAMTWQCSLHGCAGDRGS